MDIHFTYTDSGVDWHSLSSVYKRAPLGNKPAADLETTFANSRFKCFAWSGNLIVGAGRALADGLDCSYICDIAILPEFQGQGIGGKILAYLVEQSRGHQKIILYAAPGKDTFYKKYGFKPMNTAMAIFQNQEYAVEIGLINNK